MSYSHIRNAIILAIQENAFTDESFQQLRPSHKLLLVKVEDVKKKQKLAKQAISENLSVNQLRKLLSEQGYIQSMSGTTVKTRELETGHQIFFKLLTPISEVSKFDLDLLFENDLPSEELKTAYEKVQEATSALTGLMKKLEKRLKNISS